MPCAARNSARLFEEPERSIFRINLGLEHADVRHIAVLLGVVEAVADDEFVGHFEACEVGGDGRYTGQVGENCKGEEKVRRIKQYLKENGFVLDMKCSSAYGDSPSDADMMALVNRAVLVNPKKALLRRRPDGIVVHWT